MKNFFKLMVVLAVVGGLTACNKEPEGPTDFSGGCEAVDLGITTKDGKPLKWASYNVGAQNVDGYGSHFAWGETTEKTNYGWSKEGDYKWGIAGSSTDPKRGMTKYTFYVEDGDGLKTLQPADDPATVNWGTKWRTPTFNEIKNLLDETKCQWTWDEDKKGYIVKGRKTGNSIFLPAAGYRCASDLVNVGTYGGYWSSSVGEPNPSDAYGFYLASGDHGRSCDSRYLGRTIRAVTEY